MWIKGDQWFVWALLKAQNGDSIWASDLGTTGIFRKDRNGLITILNMGRYLEPDSLVAWQGRGGYALKPYDNSTAEVPAQCEGGCLQSTWEYDSNGPTRLLNTRINWWEDNPGGVPIRSQAYFGFHTGVRGAPWPRDICNGERAACGFVALLNPELSVILWMHDDMKMWQLTVGTVRESEAAETKKMWDDLWYAWASYSALGH